MIFDFMAARRYLAPGAVSFWRWSADRDAIEWHDGTTIAFRSELESILTNFEPRGLPPLDLIVTLLAACRASRHPYTEQWIAGLEGEFFKRIPEWPDTFQELLKQQHVLRLRHALGQFQLVDRVFEDWPNCTTPAEAQQILKANLRRVPAEFLAPRASAPFDPEACRWQFRQLRIRVADLESRGKDELRDQTGLDQLVEPAPLENIAPAAPVRTARELIAQLQLDTELGGVARLAGNLLAVTHLPRGLADLDDLPIGGISDITNRGPLDRLLLSELAHDDLTLTVRVAVNEALYLRRESPPRNPPRRRGILIETGIRTWGVPRVFAAAVALSLAATTERNIAVAAFRPRGDQVEPADLITRAGLIEQLAALETEAHPGAALEAFFAALGEDPGDAVLVVTEETAADPDFRRALADLGPVSLYLATVSRDGRFELWSRGPRGSKRIREARLSLDDLLSEPPPAAVPLIDPALAPGLPAIFSIRPFPLLLPHACDPQRLCSLGAHGILALTKDRRLMWWMGPGQGAQQLLDDLPQRPLRWAGYDRGSDCARLVLGGPGDSELTLLTVSLPGGQSTRTLLELSADQGHVVEVCGHNGAIFVIRRPCVDVFDSSTGRRVQILRQGTQHWQGGRFFLLHLQSGAEWYALGFDGQVARLERIVSQRAPCPTVGERTVHLVGMFESEGSDGPLGITLEGDVYSTSERKIRTVSQPLPRPVRLEAVSQDGRKVVISGRPAGEQMTRYREIDVEQGSAKPVFQVIRPTYVDADLQLKFIRQQNVRNRLSAIGVAIDDKGDPRLMLTARNGRLVIKLKSQHEMILQHLPVNGYALHADRPFEPMETTLRKGCRLHAAVWNDGSRAVLDSRGLLHLQSSDPAIAQLSLVLTDGELAGWCSDGRMFGPRYFIGNHPATPPTEIYRSVLAPLVQRILS